MPITRATESVTLAFDPARLIVGEDTDIRQGLSAAVLDGEALWLACDEGCRIERLSRTPSGLTFARHEVFPLEELLTLPAPSTEEADIEGLDVDDGWLWLVASHSVKRKKPKNNDAAPAIARKLADTSRDGNRHLLARVPIAGQSLRRSDGSRSAAAIKASAKSSALLDVIVSAGNPSAADPHLAPFVPLPGKDNGFDIEGLAVSGTRAFVGLRGPVLREWCCILEIPLEAQGRRLQLKDGGDGVTYRKHFLKLGGLGVRDLVILDDDLLILAGPTMAHDGPAEIWRWKNGAKTGASPSPSDVTRLLELPRREGCDRAEALTVFEQGVGATLVLVVFDTPARERQRDESSVTADLYRLP
jgi:hypothetical protein